MPIIRLGLPTKKTGESNDGQNSITAPTKAPFAIDSLYRFRMTGKAHPLTTRVNFESGTLTAGQIDPFGATVAFDKKNQQFYFKTQSQVQREAARENQLEELDRLVIKYGELKQMLFDHYRAPLSDTDELFLNHFRAAFENQPELTKCNADCQLSFEKLDQLAIEYQKLIKKSESDRNSEEKKKLEDFRKALGSLSAWITKAPGSEPTDQDWDQLVDRYQRLRIMVVSKPAAPAGLEDQKLLDNFRELILNQITLINGLPGGMPTMAELNQIIQTIETLKGELESSSLGDEAKERMRERLNQFITDAINLQLNLYGQPTTQLSQLDDAKYCQNLRRGFQILGPEGWRTFNQDERLIMAMNATGEPLIATMQELSGRVLDNQPVEAELFLPLLEEELQITHSEGALDKFSADEPGDIVDILENAVNAFEGRAAKEDTQ